ncbi:MAG: cold shock domain-containing protein [Pseudomonadota bacterium]
MPSGTVKWFNPDKGFGFIRPAEGGDDVFVHISALQAAGFESLPDGQPITYELVEDRRGRMSAGNLALEGELLEEPERRPRRDFGDRPPRRDYGDRPPRRDFGDRPPRGDYGDRPPRRDYGDRPPRRDFGDRPPRGDYGDRPPRRDFGDRPPRGDYGDRPPRRDFGDRPPRGDFGDRPPRRDGDRPPRRDFGAGGPPPEATEPNPMGERPRRDRTRGKDKEFDKRDHWDDEE